MTPTFNVGGLLLSPPPPPPLSPPPQAAIPMSAATATASAATVRRAPGRAAVPEPFCMSLPPSRGRPVPHRGRTSIQAAAVRAAVRGRQRSVSTSDEYQYSLSV